MPIASAPKKSDSIQFLKGIGPQRARSLEKLGYRTLEDLFFLYPRRYEDRTAINKISDVKEGEIVLVQGEVVGSAVRYFRGRGNFQLILKDDSGSISATWFNQPYLKNSFKNGDTVILYGRVGKFGKLQLQNPDYEKVEGEEETLIHSRRITPVYPLVSGLYQRSLRRSLFGLIEDHLDLVTEYLPEEILKKENFAGIEEATRDIHFPKSNEALKRSRARLIFDEFFLFELRLIRRLKEFKAQKTQFIFPSLRAYLTEFCGRLPFELTRAQKRTLEEITGDLEREIPMARLLQGDVGSGKTVIAAGIFGAAARSGFQAAFLAPTETLAEQHYETIRRFLAPELSHKLILLKGSLKGSEKKEIRQKIKDSEVLLVIGTHALLEDETVFKKLSFLVIDEQHKFGVEQRSKLLKGTAKPHFLLMTATPIPRTLAMTLYGDLDISVIDELPKDRKPIKTYWVTKKLEARAYEHIRERLARGEQGYFVYPAIEEGEEKGRTSCESDFERVSRLFEGYQLAVVHGAMPADERMLIMKDFKDGKIQVLLATTVIEVGIDNPNATFAAIIDAQYFGLSQLHQIRGRVGRGSVASICFLFGSPETDEAKKRFQVMSETQDGFKISEEDLLLRGPGDFLGTRQSGLPLFKLANLITDQAVLEKARGWAHEILEEHPGLAGDNYAPLRKRMEKYDKEFFEL